MIEGQSLLISKVPLVKQRVNTLFIPFHMEFDPICINKKGSVLHRVLEGQCSPKFKGSARPKWDQYLFYAYIIREFDSTHEQRVGVDKVWISRRP